MNARRAVFLLVALAGAPACTSAPRTPAEARARAWGRALEGRPQARRLTCESRSACDLLAAHGISVHESAFFDLLPRSDDPDLGFVGDPDGAPGRLPPEGYGVHAPPVAATLSGLGVVARAERGRDLAWLAAELEAARPVVVWVTGGCEVSRPVRLRDAAGRPFVAVAGEHTMLVIGVTRREVTVLDPADGRVRRVDADDFDAAWACLGRMAVSATPPAGR